MMIQKSIFKKSSKTYYNSTLFFEKEVKRKISMLYAFVRLADDIVDKKDSSLEEFEEFVKEYKTQNTKNEVILDFIKLKKMHSFEEDWIDAFLDSMKKDYFKTEYTTIQETKEYCYGSAEVIGLMIAKIINLNTKSYYYAQTLGRAMQFINMIRDINEDINLDRQYIPKKELFNYGFENLTLNEVKKNKPQFKRFIRMQLKRYFDWQKEAKKGFKYIPKKHLIAIKTASDMYNWTAKKIYKNPFIIYKKKVKPSKLRVILTAIKNMVFL